MKGPLLVWLWWLSGTFASDGLPQPTASISTWYTSDDGGGASDIDFASSSSDEDEAWVPPQQQTTKRPNRPMKTLEKLQQMLDETDYLMQRKPLWTSSDRSRYKRQQRKYSKQQQEDESDEERMGYTLPDLPIYNSDAEDDDVDETLQYQYAQTHARSARGADDPFPPSNNSRTANQDPYPPNNTSYGYNPQVNNKSTYQYPPQGRFMDNRNQSPIRPPPIRQSPSSFQQPYHRDQSDYTPGDPSQGNSPRSQSEASTNAVQTSFNNANGSRQRPSSQYQLPSNQQVPPQQNIDSTADPSSGFPLGPKQQQPPWPSNRESSYPYAPEKQVYGRSFPDIRQQYNDLYWQERYRQETNPSPRKESKRESQVADSLSVQGIEDPLHLVPPPMMEDRGRKASSAQAVAISQVQTETLVEAGTRLNILSLVKWGHMSVVASLLAYAAVSPRSLPLTEYNLQFYENLRLLSLVVIAPTVYMASTFDAKESDLNSFTHTFFCTFSLGYLLTFVVEIIATTGLRLAVFTFLEREVFSLTPKVALPILPWVLKEQHYRPKRITLLVVDFLTSCILCPIIEESMKLMLLINTSNLPRYVYSPPRLVVNPSHRSCLKRNFRWKTKASSRRKRKSKKVAEAIIRQPGEKDCLSANRYLSQMLAVSFAMKLCDSGRRVLLYTKNGNANKSFYAFFRGGFPIHELCGTMTALALAKRDLLGFFIPLWKLLAPAVVVHGMANFRGKKVIGFGAHESSHNS